LIKSNSTNNSQLNFKTLQVCFVIKINDYKARGPEIDQQQDEEYKVQDQDQDQNCVQ